MHAELSYQQAMMKNQRLEVDLGYRFGGDYSGVLLSATYQWVWPIQGMFNWYLGCGGAGGYWANNLEKSDGFALGVAGVVGAEQRVGEEGQKVGEGEGMVREEGQEEQGFEVQGL